MAEGPVHRRLEDREGPDQHGSDHRQGRRRRQQDRRGPGRERQHGARRRRRARRPRATAIRRSAARTATRPTCNNVALGIQYVDVWKNANELGKAAGAAALELCKGTAMASLTLPDGLVDASVAPTPADGPGFHDPGWQHRQVVHPAADADHPGEPEPGRRRRLDHQGRALRGRRRRPAPARLPVTVA